MFRIFPFEWNVYQRERAIANAAFNTEITICLVFYPDIIYSLVGRGMKKLRNNMSQIVSIQHFISINFQLQKDPEVVLIKIGSSLPGGLCYNRNCLRSFVGRKSFFYPIRHSNRDLANTAADLKDRIGCAENQSDEGNLQ
jgi:hypothetical protein